MSAAMVDMLAVSIPYCLSRAAEESVLNREDCWMRNWRDWRRISPRNMPETRFSNIWKPGLMLLPSTILS